MELGFTPGFGRSLVGLAVTARSGLAGIPDMRKHAQFARNPVPKRQPRARGRIPSPAHLFFHRVDDSDGFIAFEQKPGTLREQVCCVRKPASVTALHRQITPIQADWYSWCQVISRRQFPILVRGQERVIARMIIHVGDQRVEAHAAEQFFHALFKEFN